MAADSAPLDPWQPPLPDEAYVADIDLRGPGPIWLDDRVPASAQEAPPPQRSRFELVRASEMEFVEPEYVIEDITETSSLALAFGDPGCGKSFLGMDLALCVATGKDFHGKAVKQGLTIYIAGEGQNGLKRRVTAWEKHWGTPVDNAPIFFSRVAAQFLDQQSADAVAAAVDRIAAAEGVPRMIVIDTLARNFGAGDENQTADMNRFVAAVDDLKARYPGCTVLILHHTGHGDKKRGRGAMSLKGALDAEYLVEKSGETIKLTATKMKDAPEPAPQHFTLQQVELGRTSGGKPITSAVLLTAERPAQAQPGAMSKSMKFGMEAFLEAKRRAGLADDLGAEVSTDEWRAVFYERFPNDNPNSKKSAFSRVRTDLVEDGALVVTDDVFRLARIPQ